SFFDRPPHRLVTHGLHDPQFHDLAGQEAQRPAGIARRGRTEARGDDPCLLLAAEQLLGRRRLTLVAIDRPPEAALHEPLADVLDSLPPAPERIGDPVVSPVGAVRVSLREDLGASYLLAGPFQLLDHSRQLTPLLIRQSHDVLLVHGEPPWFPHHPRSAVVPEDY